MIEVYGASDDLVEIEGDIREEFPYGTNEDGDLLAFSDGTILRIVYSDQGVWRISVVKRGSATMGINHAPEDDESNYSDRATLDGPILWVVRGDAWAGPKP